ncbi:Hypothetical protein CINCED_3A024390 [Cinara cedri]|uniref:THAP-type domain-containing protein n=1 Tax=Cinara cedri TaxID=506608 RepID=A0A5E4MA42_9HEMI|nr:Hypothetical protein CINCED_3A024390 [Cinara cedri]
MSEMKINDFKPTVYSFLCSEHFIIDDYEIQPGTEVKFLKNDAFPTVFKYFPSYLQENLTFKQPVLPRPTISEFSVQEIPASTSRSTDPLVDNEVVPVVSSPELLDGSEYTLKQCDSKSSKRVLRSKIKKLQKRLKKRDLKIKSLKTLLYNMKKKKVPSSDETANQLEEQHVGGYIHYIYCCTNKHKCRTFGKLCANVF